MRADQLRVYDLQRNARRAWTTSRPILQPIPDAGRFSGRPEDVLDTETVQDVPFATSSLSSQPADGLQPKYEEEKGGSEGLVAIVGMGGERPVVRVWEVPGSSNGSAPCPSCC